MADKIFYVIERHIVSELNYWTGAKEYRTWTKNIDEAVKFFDRDSANYMLTRHLDGIGNTVEHMYVEPPHA